MAVTLLVNPHRYAPPAGSDPAFDFTGANGSPWASPWITFSQAGDGIVDIQGNRGRMRSGPSGISRAQYGTTSYADFDMTITLSRPSQASQYSAIAFRGDAWNGPNDGMTNSYHLSLRAPGSAIWFTRIVDNAHTNLASITWSFADGVDYKVRVQATDDALKAKIWDAAGAEPGPWNIGEVTDATHATGLIGIANNSVGGLTDIYWDDFSLTVPSGGPSSFFHTGTDALALTTVASESHGGGGGGSGTQAQWSNTAAVTWSDASAANWSA